MSENRLPKKKNAGLEMVGTSYFSHFDGHRKLAGSSLGPGTGIRQLRHQHALWQRQDLVRATLGQKSQQHGVFGVSSGSGMFFNGQMLYRHLLYSASFGGYNSGPHMGSFISENGFI